MKKNIFASALMAMAVLFTSAAATAAPRHKSDKGDRPAKTKCDSACTRGKDARTMYNPFEGLNLTDAQKAKLAELPTPSKKGVKPEGKTKTDADRLTPEQMRAKRTEARSQYLQGVKSILTPQQYSQFLENNYINAVKGGKGKAGMKGDKPRAHKGDRNKGDRPERGNRK